jgi:hypothetical protein
MALSVLSFLPLSLFYSLPRFSKGQQPATTIKTECVCFFFVFRSNNIKRTPDKNTRENEMENIKLKFILLDFKH